MTCHLNFKRGKLTYLTFKGEKVGVYREGKYFYDEIDNITYEVVESREDDLFFLEKINGRNKIIQDDERMELLDDRYSKYIDTLEEGNIMLDKAMTNVFKLTSHYYFINDIPYMPVVKNGELVIVRGNDFRVSYWEIETDEKIINRIKEIHGIVEINGEYYICETKVLMKNGDIYLCLRRGIENYKYYLYSEDKYTKVGECKIGYSPEFPDKTEFKECNFYLIKNNGIATKVKRVDFETPKEEHTTANCWVGMNYFEEI